MTQKNKKYHIRYKVIAGNFIRLKSPFFASLNNDCYRVLSMLFHLPDVKKATVNTITKSILIETVRPLPVYVFQRVFASKKKKDNDDTIISRIFYNEKHRKVSFHRHGNQIVHWEILHELSERVRLFHPFLFRRSVVCSNVEKALTDTVGVREVKINSLSGTCLITYNRESITKEQIIAVCEFALSSLESDEKKEDEKKIGNFEISTASLAMALALPEAPFLTIPLILYTAFPGFKKALQGLKAKKIKVDLLDTIVVAGSLAANQTAVAAFMVWAVALADKIQDSTSTSTGKMLEKIFGSQPRFAWLLQGVDEKKVAVTSLKKSDVIKVYVGEAIPIDGVVSDGEALVDQSALTGESQPSEKRKGEKVFSCTTVLSGNLYIRVEAAGGDTVAGKIQHIVTEAAAHQTKAQNVGEKIADHAVLPTLVLGGLGMMTGGSSAALAIVNADFGTGIRVAAPTLLLSHLVKLAKHGILVKNGGVLEKLKSVDVFLFDKTGTLTEELPQITSIVSFEKRYSRDTILRYAAIAEQGVSHPIAKSILIKAQENNIKLPPKEEAQCRIGLGVEVETEGKKVRVGSMRYMREQGMRFPEALQKMVHEKKEAGEGIVLVSIGVSVCGLIALKTIPRKDAHTIIQFLKNHGVKKTVLISGDDKHVTRSIADELGVDDIVAEVLPHQKADWVKKYKEQGNIVAMVGDGVNDGPALALADISISLKGASEIAMDTAHIIFLDGHFEKIPLLFESSHRFTDGVWSSFRLIAIPNAICIAGALTNVWGLGASLVLNNLFNIVATVKSLGPLYELEPVPTPPSLPAHI